MKNLLLLTLFGLFVRNAGFSQASGYLEEGFESTTFPPSGWTTQSVSGSVVWARSTAQAHSGAASALINYSSASGQQWLISPQFSVVSGDSVTFWMRLAYAGYAPDSLSVKVSTTDNQTASFNTTVLGLAEGVNYPANNTTWVRYAVSLNAFAGQNVYIAFKHFDSDGDGLYIDDVAIGTPPPYDAATLSVSVPTPALKLQPNAIGATVKNKGTFSASFNVTAEITPGGYTSTQSVGSLAAGMTAPVTFAPWTPSAAGTYTLRVYTQEAGDGNVHNDTLTMSVNVIDFLQNYGWESHTAMPESKWAHASVFTDLCAEDTAFLYAIGGGDGAFANSASVYRQNFTTGTWRRMADIPSSRTQISGAELEGKIYIPGGYSGSFSPVTTLSIYDPLTNSWSTGAPMPTAVGDYAIGTYGDSLIYVVGGYTGSTDASTVQIYNVHTNTWILGTPYTGTAVAGGRMGITGNQIVFCGGYSQTLASELAIARLGTIDASNPSQITWTSLPNIPSGTNGRFGGGAGLDGKVYFTAGDPNGAGTAVLTKTFAYNTISGNWEMGPDKITGVSNISNFAAAVYNDSIYMISTGGYNGSAVVNVNEWLNVGPYASATASGDTVFCGSGTVLLHATGGTAYDWSPAALLSDTTSANPTADITASQTFDVSVTRRYGCPVQLTATAVVNQPATASQSFQVCYGQSVTVGTSVHGTTGVYTDTLSTVNGCDSIVTTNLTVLPENTFTQTLSICNGSSVSVGSNTYAASGTYTDVLSSSTGCDSTVTTVLTVQAPIAFTQTLSVCNGSTVSVGQNTYSASGTYTDVLSSSTGCDSTVTTILTVQPQIDNTVSQSGVTLTAAQDNATYQWYDCNGGTTIPGATAQNFTPEQNGSYQVMITMGACSLTSTCMPVNTLGLSETAVSQIQLYPNPNNGSFTISGAAEGTFILTTELGQVIGSFELSAENGYTTMISDLASGVYTIACEKQQIRRRVVVTK